MMGIPNLTRWGLGLCLVLATGCGEVTSNNNQPDAFAQVADPTIASLSPARGPLAGGSTVTVTGAGFQSNGAGMNFVLVGNTAATDVTVVDDTTLTFVSPAGLADGETDVTVINGSGFATMASAWNYNALPTITTVSPPTGSFGGNEIVTLTGVGFKNFDAGTTTVMFGTAAATNVQATSDTTITLRTPASTGAPFERVRVTVSNSNGEALNENAYGYRKSGYFVGLNRFGRRGMVSFVDASTFEATDIMRMPEFWTIASIQAGTGDTLMVHERTYGQPGKMYQVDPYSKTALEVGEVALIGNPTGDTLRDMVKVGANWFGIASQRLASVNATTFAFSYVNTTQWGGYSNPVAVAPRDANSLWIASNTGQNLSSVSLANGSLTTLTAMSGSASSRGIMGLSPRAGQLIALLRGTDALPNDWTLSEFWSLNPGSGVLTRLGAAPNGSDSLYATPY